MILHMSDYRNEDEVAYRSSEIKPHLDMLVYELSAAGIFQEVCDDIYDHATRNIESFTAADQWTAIVRTEAAYKWRCRRDRAGDQAVYEPDDCA